MMMDAGQVPKQVQPMTILHRSGCASDLLHPFFIRMLRDPRDFDPVVRKNSIRAAERRIYSCKIRGC